MMGALLAALPQARGRGLQQVKGECTDEHSQAIVALVPPARKLDER